MTTKTAKPYSPVPHKKVKTLLILIVAALFVLAPLLGLIHFSNAQVHNYMDFDDPVGWDFAQYGSGTQILFEENDPALKHNGETTIRIDPWTTGIGNTWREQNGPWLPIHGGDIVYMGCWVKAGPYTQVPVYPTTSTYAMGIGFDIYTELGSSHEVSTENPDQWTNPSYSAIADGSGDRIAWSTDWTYISFSIVIPTVITGDGADYHPGVECTPEAILCGFSGSAAIWGNGVCWFSGMELYINSASPDPPVPYPEGGTMIDSYAYGYDADAYLAQIYPNFGNNAFSQSFSGTSGYNVTTAGFFLYKTGAPTGIMQARLYALSGSSGTTGVPTGAALATSANVTMESVSGGDPVFYSFIFPEPYYTLATQNYAIAIIAVSGAVDGSNAVGVSYDASSPTHSGNFASYESGWVAYANRDLLFTLYGDSPTPDPTPTPTPSPTASPTPAPTVPGVTPTIPPTNPLSGDFIIMTTQDFNINFADNTQLNIQDSQQNINVTFTVTSGTWQGTGNLNVTTSGGTFLIYPSTPSSLLITSSSSDFYLSVNGQPTSNGAVTFTPGATYLILWQYIPTNIPGPVIIGTTNSRLYFRSDSYTSNTVTANGLDITNTNTEQTVTSAITAETVTYGFRVWVLHKTGSTTELTGGTPEIQLTRTANGADMQNTTWTCPATTLSLGKDSLQVTIYLSLDAGATWTPKAIYVTNPLLSTALLHQTWTFNMYTTRNTTLATTSFTFGSRTYNSNINGVGMQPPTQTEIQSWRFLNGDYIAFIFGAYASIGPAAYLLMLLIPTGTLYVRHRNFGPVALFFILFGGPGGIVWLFVPAWAAIAVDILLILGCSFIVWRIIR